MATELSRTDKLALVELLEEREKRATADRIDASQLSREESNSLYLSLKGNAHAERKLCRTDLFYLLTVALRRKDADRDWLYDRCREVQASPDGHLDLWARDHYKSTIITFAKTIQDVLIDPEVTVGIFSHTRPIAKAFLEQVKRELEGNEFLQGLFPDILYKRPQVESSKWSLDGGIVVKRKTNPKEATIEAHGLVDGQPTSRHFSHQIYDDVVTLESVSTPDQIKKTTAAWEMSMNLGSGERTKRRYIGTRYHLNDTYRAMMERGSVTPRVYKATDNGKLPPEGKGILLSDGAISTKRRDMGPYTFACFPASSPVLMADWKEKPIEEIRVGDEVVGYTLAPLTKSKLTRTRVVAIKSRTAPVIEARFESGRVIRCTPDHKWYTGRRGNDTGSSGSHLTYVPLGFSKNHLKALISVYDPVSVNRSYDERAAAWLGGFFDGEGSASHGAIHFHQTSERNLIVCERLEETLKTLGFEYGVTHIKRNNPKWAPVRDYFLKGGREAYIRFLRQCRPARGHKVIAALFEAGTRNFGKTKRDQLVSITEVGEQEVFNIQTETGNYVAFGYATKNCQMLQDPVADKAMSFKQEWLKYYEQLGDTAKWNKYLIVDPASAKKPDSDYTVIHVIGLAPDNNYYLIDAIRDRLNLSERASKVFELHRIHQPKKVGYEKYGMQADVEHLKYLMEQRNYRFNITELGGAMPKEDRVKRLIPVYEQGRFYLPKRLMFVDYEGVTRDFVQLFLTNEYLAFPVCVHDDMLDCQARILDPALGAEFPKTPAPKRATSSFSGNGSNGWMG